MRQRHLSPSKKIWGERGGGLNRRPVLRTGWYQEKAVLCLTNCIRDLRYRYPLTNKHPCSVIETVLWIRDIYCLLLNEGTFTQFSYILKVIKKSQSSRHQGFSYFVAWWWTDPDPGGPKPVDSTDPDPQHWIEIKEMINFNTGASNNYLRDGNLRPRLFHIRIWGVLPLLFTIF